MRSSFCGLAEPVFARSQILFEAVLCGHREISRKNIRIVAVNFKGHERLNSDMSSEDMSKQRFSPLPLAMFSWLVF